MKMFKVLFLAVVVALFAASAVMAANTCNFIDDSAAKVITLQGDCTTDASIVIPPGYILNGNDFAITAVDPPGCHFIGAVVKN